MILSFRRYSLVTVFILCTFAANAQDKPIGYWDSFLPYNSAVGVATDGHKLLVACKQAFFTFDPLKYQMETYSKVNGMSDIGMQSITYDAYTATTILVYGDGNIDLFKDNTFYNIPDLKLKSVAGIKVVYQVYTENGIAYLSTSLGVLVIDLVTHNFNETYQFIYNNQSLPVSSFIGSGDFFYAVTTKGLYQAPKNSPQLQNFQAWTRLDSTHTLSTVASVGNTIYLSNTKTVYSLAGGIVSPVYTTPNTITHIDAGLNGLFISEFLPSAFSSNVIVMNTGYVPVDSFYLSAYYIAQVQQLPDSTVWIADSYGGLAKRTQSGHYVPPGPSDANGFDIYANNQNLWIAYGGYNDKYGANGNIYGMSNYVNGKWTYYQRYLYDPFNNISDICSIVKDEKNGTIYAGSFLEGLFILYPDGEYRQVTADTSIFDSSVAYFHLGQRDIIGLALDHSQDLWVTTMYSEHVLYARTLSGKWYKFNTPGAVQGGQLIVDDNDQIWFANAYGNGAFIYNFGGTIADPGDDSYYHMTTGVGSGNLPSNTVICLAKDNNNNIWIGTDNGIGIVSNCSAPFNQSSPPCDAQIPIVQYDQYAGYLFAGNTVRSIAVDGGNRKWVGTDNGVWLLSPDAGKIIYRFTVDNSPLPSNHIEKISIDKVTGDVYFGTDQGMVSYRSTATEGGTSNQYVTIFPDPVPSGYSGAIAIKGLVANADVRITDISGELVFRTKAYGGQAIWNGVDYKGHRPQSGVYLVFVSSSDGSQVYTGKMVFLQ